MSRNDLVLFALGMLAAAGALVSLATFVQFGREVRRRRREADHQEESSASLLDS
jgi:hypothetical protein